MKRTLLALALLLCSGGAPYADEKPVAEKKTPAPADAPSLKLPASLNGDTNDFIQIAADTNGNVVVWRVVDPGLKLFPTNLLRDTKTAVVTSGTPGRYRVWAVTALGGVPSDIAECVVVIGTPGPGPPPPPGPGPGPTPTPTPIPGVGLKCMVIYETADLGKMPSKQLQIIEAKAVRDYLNAKTVPTTDGGKRGWYITDQNADFSGESKVWQDAIKRPRTQVPWIILGDGKNGFEGPLPADVPATLELLKKFGG